MRPHLHLVTIVASLALGNAHAANDAENSRLGDVLNTSNNWLELVEEYWPKIDDGDVDAMVLTYNAINNCDTFKDAYLAADSIDDLPELLVGRNPEDIKFASGQYFRCRDLVRNVDRFPGWAGLRLRAALAGEPSSMTLLVVDFYRLKDVQPRESLPFSPGQFITSLMDIQYPPIFDMIGVYGRYYGILEDHSRTAELAWQILACEFRDVCDKPESIKQYCAYMTSECVEAKNLYDVYRFKAGSEENYERAAAMAGELHQKIVGRRYGTLGVNFVW